MTRTLLIIDDNKSVRDALRFLLERRGYRVLTAENGPEGIAAVKAEQVDGALVDVNMPGMNGIMVCRELRAHAVTTGRPLAIWMMTGARTPEVAKSALDAGALMLLAKPFDFAELFRKFDEVMGPVTPPAPPPDVLDQL